MTKLLKSWCTWLVLLLSSTYHSEDCMAPRNRFLINVDAPHRVTARVAVGMLLSMLVRMREFSSPYTSPAKAGPGILHPSDETE